MAFSDPLAGETTTIALCWRVARADGVVLGFTSHDSAIEAGGVRYEASPGMTPSAISSGLGLDVATMEFGGALSAGALTDADLGKVRGKIQVPAEAGEAEVIDIARADLNVGRHLEGQTVKRAIYVRGRIVNFVIGGN